MPRRVEKGELCARCGTPREVWKKQKHRGSGTWACGTCQTATYRRANLQRSYGISEDAYNALHAEQAGRCAICLDECASGQWLSVDHDHITKRVRGLLCRECNHGLGKFKDDVSRLRGAIKYLSQVGSENAE